MIKMKKIFNSYVPEGNIATLEDKMKIYADKSEKIDVSDLATLFSVHLMKIGLVHKSAQTYLKKRITLFHFPKEQVQVSIKDIYSVQKREEEPKDAGILTELLKRTGQTYGGVEIRITHIYGIFDRIFNCSTIRQLGKGTKNIYKVKLYSSGTKKHEFELSTFLTYLEAKTQATGNLSIAENAE